jgi:CheY-like chemotaxis protein
LNLVTNASEGLVDGAGTVSVRTGLASCSADDLVGAVGSGDVRPGTYAFLEVADDGRGMDAATRDRMFEPFFTTRFSGRGLGLAAVLGIVRAHGGVLCVHSAPGQGTVIRVLFPRGPAAAKPAENPAPGDTAERSRGTILVVDDDEFVVELAKEFLERAGHRVLTAAGGRAGIACFQERGREIDVVLLDLAMPDASGEEVLQELRRVRPGVPVIVSTGYAAEVAAKRVLEHGVAGFVRKPYEPEDLVDQIGLALAGARTRAA